MVTANHARIEELTNYSDESSAAEDARNEILRLKILENRRIEQINVLRRHSRLKNYAPR